MKKSANSSAFPPAKPTFFKAKSINALFFVIGLFFGVMLYDLRFVLFTRIESNAHLAPSHFKRNTCFKGVVLHVTDGDSLKIFHTPLTWRFCALQTLEGIAKTRFKHQTITVRLAGIDAPEMAQAGEKASGGQPYAAEAAQFLKNLVAGRRVIWRPLRIDRYGRCLASVWVNDGWWNGSSTNVSLELVGAGWAAVYRGPDAEFDGQLSRLEALERNASARRLGMWRQLRDGSYESPQDFKRRRTQNKKQSP